ncbi:hypothetical protein GCM10009843_30500 [Nocardioides bigeumensis]|jgi:hypothetical protein|uniref:Uncharacterized protein n=1 Tax=Nocardioides bigeumensis TaxID=433657 RepID=A0ABP5KAG3_9ACTN
MTFVLGLLAVLGALTIAAAAGSLHVVKEFADVPVDLLRSLRLRLMTRSLLT